MGVEAQGPVAPFQHDRGDFQVVERQLAERRTRLFLVQHRLERLYRWRRREQGGRKGTRTC